MKAAIFDYVVPKSVSEASALLGSTGAATVAIAGGQSLVPMLNLRVALPDLLVDIAASSSTLTIFSSITICSRRSRST